MQSTPSISAIAAMAENRVIGINNQLPWRLPADLRYFKQLTTGHAVLMGRKTYESIGRPLPNRLNLIMSRDPGYTVAGCSTVSSMEEALAIAAQHEKTQLFVIGGAEIYQLLMPHVERLYLTVVHQHIEGDAVFPAIDNKTWKETSNVRHPADTEHAHAYSFMTLVRMTRSAP